MTQAFAVLTAAGSGVRLGADAPKALVELDGQTLLARALMGLADSGVIGAICVTCPAGRLQEFQQQVENAKIAIPVSIVQGGATRQSSVYLGMQGLRQLVASVGLEITDSSVIMVHDAARCLATPGFIRQVAGAVSATTPAVIPGLPVTDTIKVVGKSVAGLRPIVLTPDRQNLLSIQTPQAFLWGVLNKAHEVNAHLASSELTAVTDDAGLVEKMGIEVFVCAGEERSFKITTKTDLGAALEWL